MPNLTARRYALQPYSGPKSRTTCRGCGEPRCFTRYIDTKTRELLPDEYGRCDREIKCGYALSPYTRPAGGGMSYATASERNEQLPHFPAPARLVSVPTIAPSQVSIPADMLRASLGHYERNNLARLLQQHFGLGVANELLNRFLLGTSVYWPGACVFWYIDEQGRARGGEIVLLDDTGHTVKNPERCTTWVHTALSSACKRRGEAPPPWLAEYITHGQKSPCLFGLPQLSTSPSEQPVALVESAKTAMLATPYSPRYVWMATRGLASLTPDRLEPLRGRRIVLFPDAGALGRWKSKAKQLCRLGFDVLVSEELENLATEKQRHDGLDLADVLLQDWSGYSPSWGK